MKHLWLIAAMLIFVSTALAEWNDVTTGEMHSDTLASTENDTVTFSIPEQADVLLFQICTDDAGIISAKYRVFGNDQLLHRGGSSEPISFILDGGTTTTSLTVAANECYTATINPLGVRYQQLVITSSASIKVKVYCFQTNRS